MIILMGFLHLNPSDVNEFTADIQTIASSTRAEKGCLFYSIALEDARAGRMLIAERWQDQESLTAHLERQELVAFSKKWGNRIKSDNLKYDASNERSLME
ncbi:antibiotic biosynthesis monooxygenase [Pelosinus sp. IPA-1]|uniref:putative quinol monooxygenase n=1 Tax=Pelosinus sp. IPA-1 TaxID=3029569 RepID=UPI0024362683|nr:antibiotic biosynthesis monooxygenase [Pelosinus sp. IPA-1]GMA99528.1 hypothetical protein PIPA1_23280 [Pelosinus sp. IPA-1]